MFIRKSLVVVVVLQVISDCCFCYVNNSKLKSEELISFTSQSFNYSWAQNKYVFQLRIYEPTYFIHPVPEEIPISLEPAL